MYYKLRNLDKAGIVLSGTEIKSIRKGSANLKDSYAIVKNNEIFILNMFISQYSDGNRFNDDETRTRKLLLHKKEIKDKLELEGYTLIPIKLYIKNGKAKILLGIAMKEKL